MAGQKEKPIQLTPDEERLVAMLKALGNAARFQIVAAVATCPECITQDIVLRTPLAQSTVSQHLKVLREAGLLCGNVDGPATCYCIDAENVRWLKEQIEAWLPACCGPRRKGERTGDH